MFQSIRSWPYEHILKARVDDLNQLHRTIEAMEAEEIKQQITLQTVSAKEAAGITTYGMMWPGNTMVGMTCRHFMV